MKGRLAVAPSLGSALGTGSVLRTIMIRCSAIAWSKMSARSISVCKAYSFCVDSASSKNRYPHNAQKKKKVMY